MQSSVRDTIIKPGFFAITPAADTRRVEFDLGNEQLLANGIKPDAVFIGDSITHFWELRAFFGEDGKVVINRGIGGDLSEFVRKRFAADVLQLKPGIAVLMIGTNDLGWTLEELNPATPGKVCDNISAMAKQAQDAGTPLALGSIPPVYPPIWYPVPEFAATKNRQIVETNARIKQIASERGAVFVDYHSRLIDSDGCMRRDLADDGVHPHNAGYALMAEALREALQSNAISL